MVVIAKKLVHNGEDTIEVNLCSATSSLIWLLRWNQFGMGVIQCWKVI